MKILGVGIVCAQGRGWAALESGLTEPAPEPTRISVPFQPEPFPVYAVPPEALKDRALLGGMRRADRFSKMAVLAASDALADSATPLADPERTGIVFATAFGPHNTTFAFLDDILQFGDAAVSPTTFSHSVHNAAVSYLSTQFGIRGPTWTVTRFRQPFQQAILIARTWLAEGRCDRVLVGAGEECGTVLHSIVARKLAIASSFREMRPFWDPAGPAVIPGEACVFFDLVRGDGEGVNLTLGENPPEPPDLIAVDFESAQWEARAEAIPADCWSHRFGVTPISSVLHAALSVLMLRRGRAYASAGLLGSRAGDRGAESSAVLRRIECAGGLVLEN
ncbi:MAG: beta-ketoacyl synthase chain length factor [Kiritimatiellia bacterium]|nr:beta-ketoacyl synthase chain length factor [Kiritimatiellia bacterium]